MTTLKVFWARPHRTHGSSTPKISLKKQFGYINQPFAKLAKKEGVRIVLGVDSPANPMALYIVFVNGKMENSWKLTPNEKGGAQFSSRGFRSEYPKAAKLLDRIGRPIEVGLSADDIENYEGTNVFVAKLQ